MGKKNRLPARLVGTFRSPYAEIDGYTVISQAGSDTMHLVGNEDEDIVTWAPACGVGFARESTLTPYIGIERSRPVCLKCRKIIKEKVK